MGTATIFDVARETGFSAMTVSRAINEPERVKPRTRDIIYAKICELGYSPNSAAKSLASKCTNIIYVYIPPDLETSHPFVMRVVAAIGERLGENGYSFLLARKPYENESCDGVIAMGLSIDEEERIQSIAGKKPTVIFGANDTVPTWVDVDNYHGEYEMTQYIIQKGYKNICYIGIGQNKSYAQVRHKAFCDSILANGIKVLKDAIKLTDNDEKSGFETANKLLDTYPKTDAIICASDQLALGCVRAINLRGLKIPTDIAVAGFDGFGYEMLTSPHITTVEQPIYEVGLKLAEQIMSLIKEGKVEKGIYIKPKLIVYEST